MRPDYFFYKVDNMGRAAVLGELEHLVLLGVLRLDEDAYGMRIRLEIEERTGRDVSTGAIYTTLDRLERKGLVRSEVGDPTPERGGRARRTFRLTGEGARALTEARQTLARMWSGLSLEGEGA